MEDVIEVWPNPLAAFDLTPDRTDILSPEIEFFNSSVGAVEYQWDLGNGYVSSDYELTYTYDDALIYPVTLTAISDKGCTDEVTKMVDTHGHFKTVVGPGRFGVGGLVNGGVTDQVGQRTGRLEGLQVSNKVTDTLETAELELHGNVGVFGEVLFLGDCEDSKWVKTFWQTHHGQKM